MNIDVADCCLVCAEPLEWTGIGVCGHRDLCSRCVARMRFIIKDKKCVLCKQESATVFFTRSMGDYTARPPSEDPKELQVRMHAIRLQAKDSSRMAGANEQGRTALLRCC